jgi:type I restriction enzyme, S subunit
MSFPKYEVYKDSGVEWLGKVPEQWKVVPFSLAIEYQEGPGIMTADFHDDGVPLLRISGVQQRWANLQGCNYLDLAKVESKWRHFQLEQGDLLISASASMGTICEIGEEAVGAIPYTGLIRLKPRRGFSDKNFVRFIIGSFQFSTQIDLFKAGSTIQHFGPTHLSQMKVILPPLSEQTQIARFLDRETDRIDALIAEQQRLIELLKEKRQAVISHAVTKGIDRTLPMKNSGVEWLGEVPDHWTVGSLRWYASIQGGLAKGKDYEGRKTVTLPYLRVANVQNGFLDLTEVKEIEVLEIDIERYSLRGGDVLMNEGGDNDKLGRGAVWAEQISPCLHQNHVFAIRTNDQLLPEWLATFTQSQQAQTYFYLNSKQSTNLASISASNVMNMDLPIPNVNEQKQILEYLEKNKTQNDQLIQVAVSTVSLLQERRSALISAAVTGKIDVRKWQPSPETSSPVKRTSKGTL